MENNVRLGMNDEDRPVYVSEYKDSTTQGGHDYLSSYDSKNYLRSALYMKDNKLPAQPSGSSQNLRLMRNSE